MNFPNVENPQFEEVRKLEPTDQGHADVFNTVNEKLYYNTLYLKKEVENRAVEEDIDSMFS